MGAFMKQPASFIILSFITITSIHAQEWTNVSSPRGSINDFIVLGRDSVMVGGNRGVSVSYDGGMHWSWDNTGLIDTNVFALAGFRGTLLAGTSHGLYRRDESQNKWEKTSAPDSEYTKVLVSPRGVLFLEDSRNQIFSSEDHGVIWKKLTLGMSSCHWPPILSFSASGALFCEHDSASIQRSTDNGISWESIPFPLRTRSHSLLCFDTRGKEIIVGSQEEGPIFYSTDEGVSWDALDRPHGKIHRLTLALTGSFVLESYDPSSRYETHDGGRTWNELVGYTPVSKEITCDTGTSYALARFGYECSFLVRSSDGGVTWKSLLSDFEGVSQPFHGSRDGLISSSQGLIAATDFEGVVRSTDHGESWARVPDVSASSVIEVASRKTLAIMSYSDGVLTSRDEGRTWKRAIERGLRDTSITCLAASSSGFLLAGAGSKMYEKPLPDGRSFTLGFRGGGLWRSTDDGDSWHRVIVDSSFVTPDSGKTWFQREIMKTGQERLRHEEPDLSVEDIEADTEGHLLARAKCDYRNFLYRSTDEGASWNRVRELETYERDPKHLVQTPRGEWFAGLSRSTDGGKTFLAVPQGFSSEPPAKVWPLSNGDIIAGGRGLRYLPASGNTWFEVGLGDAWVSDAAIIEGDVFVSAHYGFDDCRSGIYRLSVEALRAKLPRERTVRDWWVLVGKGLRELVYAATINSQGMLYLAGKDSTIASTSDQGRSWAIHKLPTSYIQAVFADPGSKGLWMASLNGTYLSTDAGADWKQQLIDESVESGILGLWAHSMLWSPNGDLFVGVSSQGPFRRPCDDTTKTVLGYVSIGGSRYGKVYCQRKGVEGWLASDTVLPGEPNILFRTKRGTLLSAVRGEGVYRSLDGGKGWAPANKGLLEKGAVYACNIGADLDRTITSLAGDLRGTVYAIRAFYRLFSSRDDCKSWEIVGVLPSEGHCLCVDKSGVLWIGTTTGIFRSSDGGKTWEPLSAGITSVPIVWIGVHPRGHLIAVAQDGWVFRSVEAISSKFEK
jgi:photosystem II stability/assembly factor-like uncharacterized protein